MIKPWWHTVRTKEYYDMLVASGYAWEFHSDIPFSWEECKDKLKEMGMEEE